MKNNIFYSFFVTLLLLSLNQVNSQNLNQFGLKAGANLMDIVNHYDESVENENKTGFYIGAFMEFRRSINFSIQTEVNYSSTENLVGDNIGLLHVPILLKYMIGNKFELYAGPESQFLLSVNNTDIKGDSYKKFILALDIGAGFLISKNLTLEARYNLAVSKYLDFGYRNYKRLNFIQVGLAYKFDN